MNLDAGDLLFPSSFFFSSGMNLELERSQITLMPYHFIEQLLLRDEVNLV
jgi:hypothetical protein